MLHVLSEKPERDAIVAPFVTENKWAQIKQRNYQWAKDALIGKKRDNVAIREVLYTFSENVKSESDHHTFVTDEIEGLLKASLSKQCKGQVINLGNNQEITILELARIIKDLTKSKSQITFHPLPIDDPLRRCPDTSKAQKLLAWKPKVSLSEGLSTTIEWYKSQNH